MIRRPPRSTPKPSSAASDVYKRQMKDTVLVFPHGIGSSVGAYTIYSLKSNQSAPIAMICTKADLTVASGCALANIPMIVVSNEEFDSIQDGNQITIDTKSEKIFN